MEVESEIIKLQAAVSTLQSDVAALKASAPLPADTKLEDGKIVKVQRELHPDVSTHKPADTGADADSKMFGESYHAALKAEAAETKTSK